MNELLEQDLAVTVERDTMNKTIRARWTQGYKTGASSERRRIKSLLADLDEYGMVDVKKLLWMIDVTN